MIAWLDRKLGRVTMYGLVVVLLGVIGVAALVLSAARIAQLRAARAGRERRGAARRAYLVEPARSG